MSSLQQFMETQTHLDYSVVFSEDDRFTADVHRGNQEVTLNDRMHHKTVRLMPSKEKRPYQKSHSFRFYHSKMSLSMFLEDLGCSRRFIHQIIDMLGRR